MKGETTRDGAPPALTGLSPVAALVRRHDPDRYRAALFAPAGRREALFALYAFNHEIARVRESVTTPMLGQIRLQWWREAIEEAYSGQPARHHLVAEPLTAMIRGLAPSRAHFDRLIDARERDLADEPFANLSALEDYAEATSATVIRLALELLGVDAPATETAAREIGIAHALIGLLRAMPLHVPAGRCYIPDAIAADAGLDPGDYAALRATPGLRQAVAAGGAGGGGGGRRSPRPRRGISMRHDSSAPLCRVPRCRRCCRRSPPSGGWPASDAPAGTRSIRLSARPIRC